MRGRVRAGGQPAAALRTEGDLEALLAGAGDAPVLIFKHSTTCSTSASVYREFSAALGGGELSPARAGVVRVQEDRTLSAAIARRFGVPHASPQALLLRHGRVVWAADHRRITRTALREAVARAGS